MSLLNLRVEIDTEADYNNAVSWINVCLILHNICLHLNDRWELGGAVEQEEDDPPGGAADMNGEDKRKRLMDIVAAWRREHGM